MARKMRSEITIDKVLDDIAEAQPRLRDLRRQLHEARRGHVPPEHFREAWDADEREQAQARQTHIDALEQEIARLEGELVKAWNVAAGLSDSPERLSGDDAEIEAQAAALESRRAQLEQQRGTFREDAHDAVDVMLAMRHEHVEALLASPLGALEVSQLIEVWPARDPTLVEALHAAIDGREGFTDGDRSAWEAELQTLARQAERRRRELALRAEERRLAEAQADKERAEVELAAVGT